MARIVYCITIEYKDEGTRSFVFEDDPETVDSTVESLKNRQFSDKNCRYISHEPLKLQGALMELVTV